MATQTFTRRAASMIAAALFFSVLLSTSVDAQTTRTGGNTQEESTTVGGYGEIHYTDVEGTPAGRVDVPRFIIFLEHYFSPTVSFFSELEIEHTRIAEGGTAGGEVALEQAYLQYNIDPRFNIRTGLMVLPIGIINEYHEPPTFNGVVRPRVEREFIPTTWREIGVGFVGRIPEVEGLQYRAYLTTGLRGSRFTGTSGIRGGRTAGAQVSTTNLALSARIEYLIGGLRTGGWIYFGGAGENNPRIAEGLFGAPVTMLGLDAQFNIENLYLRGLIGTASIGEARKINDLAHLVVVRDSAGNIVSSSYKDPIGSGMGGGYIEAAYDVLKLINSETTHQLLPFVRYEHFNTQASVPEGITENKALDRTFIVAGLTYKPVYNAVFKLDWTAASTGVEGAKVPGQFALGVGYNF